MIARRLAYPWYQVAGVEVAAADATLALAVWATIAVSAVIDPAAPSARIAEIMMFRVPRMIPPRRLHRSAGLLHGLFARLAQLNHVDLLPPFGDFIT